MNVRQFIGIVLALMGFGGLKFSWSTERIFLPLIFIIIGNLMWWIPAKKKIKKRVKS
jgi:hypothetical protein